MFPYNFRSKQLVRCAKIILLGGVLAGQSAICQSPLPTPNAPQHATDNRAATPSLPMNPDQLAPDAAVITIKGFCPGSASKGAPACSTTITKQQFSGMISAMSFNPQLANNPVAVKAFAESYVQALLIADAAENAGMDKDPQFEELMRIIRVRTLADAYRRSLQQKNSSPSAEQIENYYKQNTARFDQVDLDRITIPLGNPKLAKEAQAEFRQKAQTLATEARLRLATGEDPGKVQAETYRTLGLTPPLTTDLGTKRRGNLPGALEQELFALKAGDVSNVQADPSSLTIYKIRTRSTLPLERVRAEIAQEIQQREIQSALQAITGAIKTDFNDQYFKTHTAPPIPRTGK
jgi:PPIC-type PPIASE domain